MDLGTSREAAAQADCIRALGVEFIATFLFVSASVAATVAAEKLEAGALVGLMAVAVTQALFVAAVVPAAHISGGHLNPAVTLGLLAGGHMTVVRSVLYWIDQLLASSAACLLVQYLSGGLSIPVHTLGSGVGQLQGVVWEIVLTFSLLFTVYGAIVDPNRGAVDGLGPTLTGFLVGANTIAGGAFTGASMNPARSFGPALVNWNWTNHWVYWVGPLIGGGLSGLIYQNFFITKSHHVLVPTHEDGAYL